MSLISLDIDAFLKNRNQGITLDSRSESEFAKAHIPGAINIPILDDHARHIVGTIYKQEAKQAAVIKGFELSGPRFASIIEQVVALANKKPVYIYCWRGGMRSNILAWLLNLAGIEVFLLENGYKAYRNHILDSFNAKFDLLILGGKTGSGKSDLLDILKTKGQQIIDLEQLACHKGSAFGALGMPTQPSIEHFENVLAHAISLLNPNQSILLENESRQIGAVNIPEAFFFQMRVAPVIEVNRSKEDRIQRIIKDYGAFPNDVLVQRTEMLKKRLGPDRTKTAIEFLQNGNLQEWLNILLLYYDKAYNYGLESRLQQPLCYIETQDLSDENIAENIFTFCKQYIHADQQ